MLPLGTRFSKGQSGQPDAAALVSYKEQQPRPAVIKPNIWLAAATQGAIGSSWSAQ